MFSAMTAAGILLTSTSTTAFATTAPPADQVPETASLGEAASSQPGQAVAAEESAKPKRSVTNQLPATDTEPEIDADEPSVMAQRAIPVVDEPEPAAPAAAAAEPISAGPVSAAPIRASQAGTDTADAPAAGGQRYGAKPASSQPSTSSKKTSGSRASSAKPTRASSQGGTSSTATTKPRITSTPTAAGDVGVAAAPTSSKTAQPKATSSSKSTAITQPAQTPAKKPTTASSKKAAAKKKKAAKNKKATQKNSGSSVQSRSATTRSTSQGNARRSPSSTATQRNRRSAPNRATTPPRRASQGSALTSRKITALPDGVALPPPGSANATPDDLPSAGHGMGLRPGGFAAPQNPNVPDPNVPDPSVDVADELPAEMADQLPDDTDISPATPGATPTEQPLDTRDGLVIPAGQSAAVRVIEGTSTGNVSAVAVTVSVSDPMADGELTIATGANSPSQPALQYAAGEPASTTVMVTPAADGTITVGSTADVRVIVDLHGSYPTAAGVTSVPRTAVADNGTGQRSSITAKVAGRQGIPADASGVAISVTATDATAPGKISVTDADGTSQALTIDAENTASGFLWVRPTANGTITVASDQPMGLTVEVLGFAAAKSTMKVVDPVNIFTGSAAGVSDADKVDVHSLAHSNQPNGVRVAPMAKAPAAAVLKETGAEKVLLRVAVAEAASPGYVMVGQSSPKNDEPAQGTALPHGTAMVAQFSQENPNTTTFVADVDSLGQFWVSTSANATTTIDLVGVITENHPDVVGVALSDVEEKRSVTNPEWGTAHVAPGGTVSIAAPAGFRPLTTDDRPDACEITAAGVKQPFGGTFDENAGAWTFKVGQSNLVGDVVCLWEDENTPGGAQVTSDVELMVTSDGDPEVTLGSQESGSDEVVRTTPQHVTAGQWITLTLDDDLGLDADVMQQQPTGGLAAHADSNPNGRLFGSTIPADELNIVVAEDGSQLSVQMPDAATIQEHFGEAGVAPNVFVLNFGTEGNAVAVHIPVV